MAEPEWQAWLAQRLAALQEEAADQEPAAGGFLERCQWLLRNEQADWKGWLQGSLAALRLAAQRLGLPEADEYLGQFLGLLTKGTRRPRKQRNPPAPGYRREKCSFPGKAGSFVLDVPEEALREGSAQEKGHGGNRR